MRKDVVSIIITIIIFFIIVVSIGLIISQMGERFLNDCEKQNNIGIVSYLEFDIDCSQIDRIKNNEVAG